VISIKFVLQLPKNEFKIYQLAHFYFPFFYLGQQLYSDERRFGKLVGFPGCLYQDYFIRTGFIAHRHQGHWQSAQE